MSSCFYCDRIQSADAAYTGRAAQYDLGSEAPRCAWHWRFICDCCGAAGHYMTRFFCPRAGQLFCGAAGSVEYRAAPFWDRHEAWFLRCPACGEEHASLDRAEFEGAHPWQMAPDARTERRWLSPEPYLQRYPPANVPTVRMETLSDADIDANWSRNADIWNATYDSQGDRTRKYFSDPVVFAFLGDVAGQDVLDAGCGAGYLARILAQRGARVVGVENARRFYELATAREASDALGIAYYHASISNMPFLADASFDAVVANFVLMDVLDYTTAVAEIARVLRPGGRFVFVITHTSTHGHWVAPAPDSPRREDRSGWLEDRYFVRDAGYSQWGALHPVLGFNRPFRDYIAACRAAGLALRDIEEPELSAQGRRELPPWDVREASRLAYNWVVRCEKAPATG
ncbi:MAG: hypothetical protein DCC58_03855 [Chloroflexi bacterium]|nr:MAG: hypothetical protein DCC58_03855 [Chloroflexota bacterium]